MPRMTGLQAARQIRAHLPETQVLALSMHDDERYVFDALKAGASGYVLKREVDQALLNAIRAVNRGEAFLTNAVERTIVREWMNDSSSGPEEPLSPREQEVLKLIAEAYTNKQIAETLHLAEKTVESHRANLLRKLGMRDRVELVRYAIRRGLTEATPALKRSLQRTGPRVVRMTTREVRTPFQRACGRRCRQSPGRAQRTRAANGFPAGIVENPAWSANCAAHMALPGAQRLPRELAHRGVRAARLQRGRARTPPAARCSPTRRRWACRPTGRTGRTTSPSCWRRSSRSRATPTAASTPGPATSARSRRRCETFTYPADGATRDDEPVPVRARLRRRDDERDAQRRLADRPGRPDRPARSSTTRREEAEGYAAAGRLPDPGVAARGRHALHRAGHVHVRHGRARASSAGASPPARVGAGQTLYGEAEPTGASPRLRPARRAHAQGLARAVSDHQRRDPGPDHHARADDRPPRARERAAARLHAAARARAR